MQLRIGINDFIFQLLLSIAIQTRYFDERIKIIFNDKFTLYYSVKVDIVLVILCYTTGASVLRGFTRKHSSKRQKNLFIYHLAYCNE